MKSSGVTFTLTPDEANSFDLDLGHFVQDRNGSPGKSLSVSNVPSDARYTRNNYALMHYGNYDVGMTPVIFSGRKPAIPHERWKRLTP